MSDTVNPTMETLRILEKVMTDLVQAQQEPDEGRAALCIHCQHAISYKDVSERERVWAEMSEHEMVCPKNPVLLMAEAALRERDEWKRRYLENDQQLAQLAEWVSEPQNERDRLRDQFAMHAMDQATINILRASLHGQARPEEWDEKLAEGMARAAYLIADAMLLVREGK